MSDDKPRKQRETISLDARLETIRNSKRGACAALQKRVEKRRTELAELEHDLHVALRELARIESAMGATPQHPEQPEQPEQPELQRAAQ